MTFNDYTAKAFVLAIIWLVVATARNGGEVGKEIIYENIWTIKGYRDCVSKITQGIGGNHEGDSI